MDKRKAQKRYANGLTAASAVFLALTFVFALVAGRSNGATVLAMAGLAVSFFFKGIDMRVASMPDEPLTAEPNRAGGN